MPGFCKVGSKLKKYAASPETIAVEMEVPSLAWPLVPVPSAHQTPTPGAHSETRGPCCDFSHSLPILVTAPTMIMSGNSAAKSAGYVSTIAEPPGTFYTGQSSLREHRLMINNRSRYPTVPGCYYDNSIELE